MFPEMPTKFDTLHIGCKPQIATSARSEPDSRCGKKKKRLLEKTASSDRKDDAPGQNNEALGALPGRASAHFWRTRSDSTGKQMAPDLSKGKESSSASPQAGLVEDKMYMSGKLVLEWGQHYRMDPDLLDFGIPASHVEMQRRVHNV